MGILDDRLGLNIKQKMTHTFLAENLKKLRHQKSLSQEKASARIGIKRCSLGAYEEGRAEPGARTLLKIAKFYDVTIEELITNNKNLIKKDNEAIKLFDENIERKIELIKHLITDIEQALIKKIIKIRQ